jgi:predicted amidohydrolase
MDIQHGGPRKVVVGTSMYAMWGEYPGLEKRLAQLGGLVDRMAVQAKEQYGRSVDICALPEVAVTGGLPLGPENAVAFGGPVHDYFGAKAREHNCYITVPMVAKETVDGRTQAWNACALMGREGELVGMYRKVHVVTSHDSEILEGGCRPGCDFPVFACDFGNVGIQICFDIEYDDGWQALGRKGAELVIWSTQSPGQLRPAFHAMRNNYYVLTSTWRNNASLMDPTGHVIKSILKADGDETTFVDEIDLEYRLLPWQPKLRNGEALRQKYGDRAGFRYSEAEDGGIFWSNDPATPIEAMVRELGLICRDAKIENDRKLQDKARGGPPRLD